MRATPIDAQVGSDTVKIRTVRPVAPSSTSSVGCRLPRSPTASTHRAQEGMQGRISCAVMDTRGRKIIFALRCQFHSEREFNIRRQLLHEE